MRLGSRPLQSIKGGRVGRGEAREGGKEGREEQWEKVREPICSSGSFCSSGAASTVPLSLFKTVQTPPEQSQSPPAGLAEQSSIFRATKLAVLLL